jgi:hypothetical protein
MQLSGEHSIVTQNIAADSLPLSPVDKRQTTEAYAKSLDTWA